MIWGLWALDLWAVICGIVTIAGAKLWFVDRCIWVLDDLRREGLVPPIPGRTAEGNS